MLLYKSKKKSPGIRQKGFYFMMNQTKEKKRKAKAIIAMVNDKGGCGKSTSTFHIAGELAKRGRKVLAVDADKQRNLTTFLLGEEESQYDEDNDGTLLDIMLGKEQIENVIKKNYIKVGNAKPQYMGIDVIPADAELEKQEIYFPLLKDKDLSGIFDDLDYDYIIIDCPPSNTMVEHFILEQWATHVLIPMSSDISSVMGMGDLIKKIDAARKHNPELKIIGAFYSMFLPMRNKSKKYFKAMERRFSNLFIESYIPFLEDVTTSLEDEGRPLAFYRKSGACKYVEELTSQILKRL